VLREPDRLSPVTFTLIEDRGRRYARYTRGDTTPLVPDDLPATLFDQVRLLYVDAEMPEVQIVAAERARARGARVVLGVRRMGPGLGELLDLADVVIASERVAAEIAHSADIERTLLELTKMGPDIAVITLGDDGAVALYQDKLVRQQSLAIDVVDVTGAGSVFRGAFTYALLRDWPLELALPFANAAAGLNCASIGGQGGIPSLEAVERAVAG
jgi:ribokinase